MGYNQTDKFVVVLLDEKGTTGDNGRGAMILGRHSTLTEARDRRDEVRASSGPDPKVRVAVAHIMSDDDADRGDQ